MTSIIISILVPIGWPQKLDELARQKLTNRSQLIRETLEKCLHVNDVKLETNEVEQK